MKSVFLLAAACMFAELPAVDFGVMAFGAKGDGVAKDTVALQKAIDSAAEAGGGRIVVPAGKYLTGSIYLKDNVELHLEKGAVLFGSPDKADYNAGDICPQNWTSKAESNSGAHLILAVERRNVAITGQGKIDGNCTAFLLNPDGRPWPGGQGRIPWRPGQMLYFVECDGVRVEGVVRVGDNYSRSGVGIEVAVVVLRERTGFRKVRFCLVVEVGFDSTAQNVVEEVAEVLHLYGILEEERVDSERHVQFLTGSAVRLLRGKSRRYEFFDTAVDEGVDPDGVVVCRGYRLAVDAAGESAPTAAHAAAAGRSEYEAVGVGSRHYDVGAARAAGRVAFRTGQVCDGVVVDDGIRQVGIMRACCF